MEDNEDEPEDVRRATPVEEEIRKGEIDEYSGRPTQPLEASRRRRYRCDKVVGKKKLKEKSEAECCHTREAKASSRERKTATVFVYEKKCTLPKIKAIPRHCLTKEEWIDILATPSRKCPSSCPQKLVTRRVRPVSTRMAELAQPPKQRLLNTLESRGGTLPTELVDNLIQTLEGETSLTPEQAEKMFRDKEIRSKKKCREKKSKLRCTSEKYKKVEPGVSSSVSPFDKDAVNCQYLMAESFVRSILDWKCPIPREEFKDIAEVILKRLGFILEYNPINGEDRKSQQMRLLADVIASWISGVLFEVAEARKTELEEECERRRGEKVDESEEDSDEDDTDEVFSVKEDDEDDDDDEDEPDDDEEKEDSKSHGGGGGGDDQSKEEDKEGKDDEGKEKPAVEDTKESSEEDFIVDAEIEVEDDVQFNKWTGETSQEIGEKKTSVTRPQLPGEMMKNDESVDKMPEGESIESNGEKIRKEGKKDEGEYPPDNNKEVAILSEKNDFYSEKWDNHEISRQIDQQRVTKDSESKNYREKSEIDIFKLMEAAKKNVDEKEPTQIVKYTRIRGPAISEDSSGMTEPKKTKSDKEEILEIYARLVEAEKMGTASDDESSATEGTKIGKEEMTRIIGNIREAEISGMTMTRDGNMDQGVTKIPKDLNTATSFVTRESQYREKLAEINEKRRIIMEKSIIPTDKSGKKSDQSVTRKMTEKSSSGLMIEEKYPTEAPFVTFDEIFHTIYNAMEKSNENNGSDAIVNSIHRAVYEKFSNVVREEMPGSLPKFTEDALEIMSGKIAIWLRNVLTESRVNFYDNKFPASVASNEIVELTRWRNVSFDTGDYWSMWIKNKIRRADVASLGKLTRDILASNLKENIDNNDLRWNRYYVESFDRINRNLTMIRDERFVKTVTRQFLEYNEDHDENETDVSK